MEQPSVLVVDDSPTILRFVEDLLSNCLVESCDSWTSANRQIHSAPPAAIVLDENLGGFKGSYLVRAIRLFFPTIPIVIMSSEACAKQAKDAGANAYVPKQALDSLPRVVQHLLATTTPETCQIEPALGGLMCSCGAAA